MKTFKTTLPNLTTTVTIPDGTVRTYTGWQWVKPDEQDNPPYSTLLKVFHDIDGIVLVGTDGTPEAIKSFSKYLDDMKGLVPASSFVILHTVHKKP